MGDEFTLHSVVSRCENPDYGVARVQENGQAPVLALIDASTSRLKIGEREVRLNPDNNKKHKEFIDSFKVKVADSLNLTGMKEIQQACGEINPAEKKHGNVLTKGISPVLVAFGAGFTDKFVRPLRDAGQGNSNLRDGLQGVRWGLNAGATFMIPQFYPELSPTGKLVTLGLYLGSIGGMAALDREGALALYGINAGTNIVSALIADKAGHGWSAGFQLIAGLGFTVAGAILYTTATPVRAQDVGMTPTPNDMFFSGPNAFQNKQQLLNGVDFLEIGTNNLAAGGLRLGLHLLGKKSDVKLSFNALRGEKGQFVGAMGGLRLEFE